MEALKPPGFARAGSNRRSATERRECSRVNIYDQLHEIRDELQRRGATNATIQVMDKLIAQAEPERENPLSVSQSMMFRHLLRQRDVLNNSAVEMDILSLAGDFDEQRPARREEDMPDATDDADSRPQHNRNYYKKLKERQRRSMT
jgi:hypothetical protein